MTAWQVTRTMSLHRSGQSKPQLQTVDEAMSHLWGCAAIIALVVFVLTLAVLLVAGLVHPPFAAETGFGVQAGLAAMLAGNVSLAFFLLMLRDSWRHRSTVRKVRAGLLTRFDVSDEAFAEAFPEVEARLLQLTRRAVAEFFDLPPEKIHSDDSLREDLLIDVLEPSFHMHVIFCVAQLSQTEMLSPEGELEPFQFSTADMSTVAELAVAVGEVLRSRAGHQSTAGDHDGTEDGSAVID